MQVVPMGRQATLRDTEPYLCAAGLAALVNFPLWKATAIRQSGFSLPPQETAWRQFWAAYKPPYRGVFPAWFGMTWARAAIFSGSEVGKRWLQEHTSVQGVASSALPALVTAGSVQCVNTPLFKATVALQNPRSPHRTVFQSLRGIYHQHGVRGLVHGTSAGVLKTAPKYGVAVLVKDLFEDYYKTRPPVYTREELLGRAALKSVVAGLCSAVFCNPFDVIRNTMFQRPHSTLYNNAAFLIQSEGAGFMVRGLQNNLLSVCVPIALTIFLADVFKRLFAERDARMLADLAQRGHTPA